MYREEGLHRGRDEDQAPLSVEFAAALVAGCAAGWALVGSWLSSWLCSQRKAPDADEEALGESERAQHRLREPKLKDPIPNLTPIFQPNHQTLDGSFSSASKPIFAPKYAFCSIFRELQDLQSFAPLQFQNLRKIS